MNDPSIDDNDWIIDSDEDVAICSGQPATELEKWRVLVVDDDEDVHAVTRLALRGISYKGRAIDMFSAYSGIEGFELMRKTDDVAMVLLDVVMESSDAGLILARRIREELHNQAVRIVLRTGQPGQVPEQSVIVDYDINDYKSKTDLTTPKLFTTVIAALRAYESLVTLERNRIGLDRILTGATSLYGIRSLREFASGVLQQVGAILDVGVEGVLCVMPAGDGGPNVVAATGNYIALTDSAYMPVGHSLQPIIARAFNEKRSQFAHVDNALFIRTEGGRKMVIGMTLPWPLLPIQRELLEVFCLRIGAAFDNLKMFGQLRKAQEATVMALADLAEYRDPETGEHLRRVEYLSARIARTMLERGAKDRELTPELMDMIGLASILHDVGKVSTPDHVLLKPGKHTPEERDIMQTHAAIGHAILERAATMVDGVSYLRYAAQIAGGHHEHFDGGGYPDATKGKDIPLAARVVAIVDVFDALLHRRPYKEPWAFADVVSYIRERRGTQFDPEVVDALFDVIAVEPGLDPMARLAS